VNGTAMVRLPSSRLAEGIVTHISRTPVNVTLARAQHAAYAGALAAGGWIARQVPAADDRRRKAGPPGGATGATASPACCSNPVHCVTGRRG
jgi:hypothetical protein